MNQGSKYMDIFRMDMSTKKLIKFADTQLLLVNDLPKDDKFLDTQTC